MRITEEQDLDQQKEELLSKMKQEIDPETLEAIELVTSMTSTEDNTAIEISGTGTRYANAE